MPTPGGRIEAYPLAMVDIPLGLVFGFETSVGVSSSRSVGSTSPTTYVRLEAGLHYRLSLLDGGMVLIPGARFQSASFALSEASDGTKETELPNVAYTGPAFGLGAEVRITDGWHFLVGGDFVLVIATGEL